MFTLSAFADEIAPDPIEQLAVLASCGVAHIELRSIYRINVLDLTDQQVEAFRRLLNDHGVHLSAIGSPIGKIRVDQPFEAHLTRFRRALQLCEIFGTPNLRIFSYYLPEGGGRWEDHRGEVMNRMREKVRLAEEAGVRLLHENEHGIYGDSPERVVDLLTTLDSPSFRAVYDPANYVFCGYDPWEGWLRTRDWTVHFHIKDWVKGETHGRLPGTGDGRIADVIKDVAGRYIGFATLEPHLLGGGPTGGVTGPDLFPQAVAAFKAILDRAGAAYR